MEYLEGPHGVAGHGKDMLLVQYQGCRHDEDGAEVGSEELIVEEVEEYNVHASRRKQVRTQDGLKAL